MIASILIVILGINAVSGTNYACSTSAPCGCYASPVSVTARIVGGQDAPLRAWPWILSLRYNGNHVCAATLIQSNYAMTSAHCLSTNRTVLRNFTVVGGINNLNGTLLGQTRSLQAVYIHPGFNYTAFANDFALIRFTPFTTGPFTGISILCYPLQGQDPFVVGDNLIAIGWGVKSYDSAVLSNALQQVTLQVIDSSSTKCQQSSVRDPVRRFCATVANGSKDTCQGDSGGPVMAFQNARWVVAGIPSSGRRCAVANYSGVYTRVSQFRDFVDSVFNNPDNATTVVYPNGTSTGSGSGRSVNLPHTFVYFYALALAIFLLFH